MRIAVLMFSLFSLAQPLHAGQVDVRAPAQFVSRAGGVDLVLRSGMSEWVVPWIHATLDPVTTDLEMESTYPFTLQEGAWYDFTLIVQDGSLSAPMDLALNGLMQHPPGSFDLLRVRQGGALLWEAAPSRCPLHHKGLSLMAVPIVYGLVTDHPSRLFARRHFPFGRTFEWGGCCRIGGENHTVLQMVCPDCQEAFRDWQRKLYQPRHCREALAGIQRHARCALLRAIRQRREAGVEGRPNTVLENRDGNGAFALYLGLAGGVWLYAKSRWTWC